MTRARNRGAAREGGPGRFRARLAAVLPAAALGAAAIGASGPSPDPVRAWSAGPIRVLLEDEDLRRYDALRTAASRAAFVESFWLKLDPDPATTTNEFRELFERRCEEVERRFATARWPGWKTDRGRVYLFLGEPDAIRPEPGDAWSISKEVWEYERAGAAGALRLVFFRGTDGEHRLNPRPRGEPFSTSVDRDRVMRYWTMFAGVPRPFRRALFDFLLTNLGGGGLADREDLLRGRPAGAAGDASQASIRDEAYFFRAADGRVAALTVVSVARPEGAAEPLVGAGYVFSASEGEKSFDPTVVDLELLPGAAGAGRDAYAGRAILESGAEYRVRFAFTDRDRRTLLVRSARLAAPDLRVALLRASSVVPAESFGPAGPHAPGIFAIGSESVIPRVGETFRRSETLRLYLQVYGAAVDPLSQSPRVDVTYRFEHLRGGRFRRHQRPLRIQGATGASLGLTLPVGDWPAGEYRVDVELRDRVSGAMTSSGGAFSIRD